MTTAARSAATLAVLAAILVVWVVWGFTQTTKPFPAKAEVPTCVDVAVPAGSRVQPADVTISVLNAGSREGLAGRTMQVFEDAGFAAGDSGNAPEGTTVDNAQIWTTDPDNPAVRLVASRIDGVEIVDQASSSSGVTVVVGDRFAALATGKKSIKAKKDAVVCGPSAG